MYIVSSCVLGGSLVIGFDGWMLRWQTHRCKVFVNLCQNQQLLSPLMRPYARFPCKVIAYLVGWLVGCLVY